MNFEQNKQTSAEMMDYSRNGTGHLPARSQGPGETAVTPVLEGGSGARGGSSSTAPHW